ncbi:MAG TPA: DNA-3-methyladenine glycosylase I [Alphaproteobacteria bacterium]|nr:DNA-3-methyladenine glycosylase I [Alphaproteobacteria bacterium]
MTMTKTRCVWPGQDDLYITYHDEEWGVPEYDDRALYEKLILDGFQAGLSWITILRKRENFRAAFDQFEPARIARYNEKKIQSLLQDAGIIRHRGKIEAAISGAQTWLAIMEQQGFSNYLWNFVDGKPIQNSLRGMGDAPAQTPLSQTIAKDLKQKGFKFCGPVIVYAFMQAVGMVNDHMTDCFRHKECAKLGKRKS